MRFAPESLAAAALIAAPAPLLAKFDPPIGRTLHVTTSQTRGEGKDALRFAIEREVMFAHEGNGFRARTVVRGFSSNAGAAGQSYLLGASAFKDIPVTIHLAADGTLLGVDDADALWERLCAALAEIATGGSPEGRNAAAAFRGFSAERRRAMLASSVTALIAGPRAERPAGAHRVIVPAQAFDGSAAQLAGSEKAVLAGTRLTLATNAAGDVAPPPGAPAGPARIAIERIERIERAHGLLVETRETRRLTLGSRHDLILSTTAITDRVF